MRFVIKKNPIILVITFFFLVPALVLAESIEGEFTKVIIDKTDGTAEVKYSVKTADSKVIELNLDSLKLSKLPKTGDVLKVNGYFKKQNLFETTKFEEASEETRNKIKNHYPNIRKLIKSGVSTTGVRSLIFLKTPDSTCSEKEIIRIATEMTNKSLNLSSGRFSFDSDLDKNGSPNVYTVDISENKECDYGTYRSDAINAFNSRNERLSISSSFSVVLFSKHNSQCNYRGAAEVPGSFAHINECSFETSMHEVGHNQGIMHASFDKNKNSVIEDSSEMYGDQGSYMSNEAAGKRDIHNSFQAYKLGWIDSQTESYEIDFSDIREHELVEISNASDSFAPKVETKVVRINKGGRVYFVSYYENHEGQHLLHVHRDGEGYRLSPDLEGGIYGTTDSILIHSVRERQSVAIEQNFWITFLKRVNGVVSFKVSEKKLEGYVAGVGRAFADISPYKIFAQMGDYATSHGLIGLFYPTNNNEVQIIQVTNYSGVDFYYQDGSIKTKKIREIPINSYGKYKVNLPGSRSAWTKNIGEVIKFTGRNNLGIFISTFQSDTSRIYLRRSGTGSLIRYSATPSFLYAEIPAEKMYFKLEVLEDGTGELTYSPSSLNIPSSVANIIESTDTCVDSDGDGWGWDGKYSCRVDSGNSSSSSYNSTQTNEGECIDHDGDGWGWNGKESCRVGYQESTYTAPQNTGLSEKECIDSDGDGWGWNGEESCRVK